MTFIGKPSGTFQLLLYAVEQFSSFCSFAYHCSTHGVSRRKKKILKRGVFMLAPMIPDILCEMIGNLWELICLLLLLTFNCKLQSKRNLNNQSQHTFNVGYQAFRAKAWAWAHKGCRDARRGGGGWGQACYPRVFLFSLHRNNKMMAYRSTMTLKNRKLVLL